MKILALLERLCADETVSDVHVKEGHTPFYRKGGVLHADSATVAREDFLEFFAAHEAQTGFLATKLDDVLKKTGDQDFALRAGRNRYRGNVYHAEGRKLAAAFRRLSSRIPALDSLGLPAAFLPLLDRATRGLLLVTGATGSGKTTTLAASVDHLNKTRAGHIITLEDPIEFIHASQRCLVDQRQIGADASSYFQGLRSALRQDPDVLLVGELRDHDTVKTAFDAANTGHLVLGTLHTNSAIQTVDRLLSFFPGDAREWAQAVLSQILLGVVSQTLVANLAGGRTLAAEILLSTPDVRGSIREGKIHQLFNHMDTGSAKGHLLMNTALAKLVRARVISQTEALATSADPERLKRDLANA